MAINLKSDKIVNPNFTLQTVFIDLISIKSLSNLGLKYLNDKAIEQTILGYQTLTFTAFVLKINGT